MAELVISISMKIGIWLIFVILMLQQTSLQEEINLMTYLKGNLANLPFGNPYMTLKGEHLSDPEQALWHRRNV